MRVLRVVFVVAGVVVTFGLPPGPARAEDAAAARGDMHLAYLEPVDGTFDRVVVSFPDIRATGTIELGARTFTGDFAFTGLVYRHDHLTYCRAPVGGAPPIGCAPVVGWPMLAHAPTTGTAPIEGPVGVVHVEGGADRPAGSCGGPGSFATSPGPRTVRLVLSCDLHFGAAPSVAVTVTIELVELAPDAATRPARITTAGTVATS